METAAQATLCPTEAPRHSNTLPYAGTHLANLDPGGTKDFRHHPPAAGMIYWAYAEVCFVTTWLLVLFKEDWWKPGYTEYRNCY